MVSATSPVPGGMSMNMTSTSPQKISVQNCFTMFEMIGPRQMTGSVSFCMSRLSDMTLMPLSETAGYRTPSAPMKVDSPKARGIEGPVMSESRIAVERPLCCALVASSEVTSDLPTPPLPLTTPISLPTLVPSCSCSYCGSLMPGMLYS